MERNGATAVLRGNYTAKIDDKGRLKVPSEFRALTEAHYGPKIFITSLDGRSVRLYPLSVWEDIENRLATMASTDPTRVRLLRRVMHHGQMAEFDAQGRVLIPARLRATAEMTGEVDVIGMLSYLEVWNSGRLSANLEEDPLTEDDWQRLSNAGV
ncbi:MAG: division/cell wall cluster transcriptional repressor MraZ [Acidobacteria bacterium]|nr:division/cell wall cluster transcriptional repressor MraZ [Acidobacteriota bacterium]